jgi:hypothetical protein
MSTHPIGEIAGGDPRTTALRQMTPEQLLHLGSRQVAYLRSSMCDGEVAFVLFGADGAPLVIAGDVEKYCPTALTQPRQTATFRL